MRNVSRRRLFGAVATSVALGGCMERNDPESHANIIASPELDDFGCVESVSTETEDRAFLFSDSVILEIELVEDHGYGKATAEWERPTGDADSTFATIERGDGAVTLEIEGQPEFIHLSVECNGAENVEFIVEVSVDE